MFLLCDCESLSDMLQLCIHYYSLLTLKAHLWLLEGKGKDYCDYSDTVQDSYLSQLSTYPN